MYVTGIIAEYDPFHNGHVRQLVKVREELPDTRFIVVMSGSFTQRGSAAVLDKWQRAELAVRGGVDLVLELPFVFAVRSAQDFARGGVRLLDSLGIVDYLAFGAETEKLPVLQEIAAAIDSSEISLSLRRGLSCGKAYAASLTEAVAADKAGWAALMHEPNNILAIEYLRALRCCVSRMQPLLIPRRGASYHGDRILSSLASATAIRREMQQTEPSAVLLRQALPAASYEAVLGALAQGVPDMEQLLRPLLSQLYRLPLASLSRIYGMDEGLENRLAAAAGKAGSYRALLDGMKSKRYPYSRLQRLLLFVLLRLTKDDAAAFDAAGPAYARVLAFNTEGRKLLRQMRQQASVPVITKLSDFLTSQQRMKTMPLWQQMLAYDTWATDFQGLCLPKILPAARDFLHSPHYITS